MVVLVVELVLLGRLVGRFGVWIVYLHVGEDVGSGSVESGHLLWGTVGEGDVYQVALSPRDVLSCGHQVVSRLGSDGVTRLQLTETLVTLNVFQMFQMAQINSYEGYMK